MPESSWTSYTPSLEVLACILALLNAYTKKTRCLDRACIVHNFRDGWLVTETTSLPRWRHLFGVTFDMQAIRPDGLVPIIGRLDFLGENILTINWRSVMGRLRYFNRLGVLAMSPSQVQDLIEAYCQCLVWYHRMQINFRLEDNTILKVITWCVCYDRQKIMSSKLSKNFLHHSRNSASLSLFQSELGYTRIWADHLLHQFVNRIVCCCLGPSLSPPTLLHLTKRNIVALWSRWMWLILCGWPKSSVIFAKDLFLRLTFSVYKGVRYTFNAVHRTWRWFISSPLRTAANSLGQVWDSRHCSYSFIPRPGR